jgi:uncharacterized membrane protein YfcA
VEPAQFIFCALVTVAAFAVRSTAGFGSAVIAVPLIALVLPIHTAVPVVANLQLASTIDHGARSWRMVAWRELLRITPYMIAGVLIGLYLFSVLEASLIRKALGAFVALYALWALGTAGRRPDSARRLPWPISALLNTTGALVGALFGGAASPFYAIYLSALRLSRDAFRATMTMILLVQVALRVAGYTTLGLVDARALLVTVVALPFMLVGARLGDVISGRVDERTFKWIVGSVLLLSGVALILK